MNIIKHKNIYFLTSAIIIIPGLISLFLWGIKPSIDFTGGSVGEYRISSVKYKISGNEIKNIVKDKNITVESVKSLGNNEFSIRTNTLTQKKHNELVLKLKNKYKNVVEKSFDTVGPIIGAETEANALKAVIIASIAITLYVAFAFRKVSRPVASWKFGVCAVAALLHDLLVVVGLFSLLGHFAGVEVDSLFITALLTVMGFSVHDTIVVFDRIRENLKKTGGDDFNRVVNDSMLETMNRSLNTSFTVILVLVSLLFFGGESTRWFVVALLVGIISGTYSSIFNASPLLVLWQEWDKRKR